MFASGRRQFCLSIKLLYAAVATFFVEKIKFLDQFLSFFKIQVDQVQGKNVDEINDLLNRSFLHQKSIFFQIKKWNI